MTLASPAALFGLKMALCLVIFLFGAAWLRRFAERIKQVRGLPPGDASPLKAISHYLGKGAGQAPQMAHERLLYRQTIRLLIKELERLDPANDEAREANDLLQQTLPGAERSAPAVSSSAIGHRECRCAADHSPAECQTPAGQAPRGGKRFSMAGVKTGASIVAVALLLVLASSARQATAQASLCDQVNAGRMEVQGGVRCVCIRTQGGLIAPALAGWRWDCSVLRSRNNALIEASPGGYEGELPSSVYIDEGWHEIPEDKGGDRKRMGRPHGPDRKRPDFHDRDRHRSRRDHSDHPGLKSPTAAH